MDKIFLNRLSEIKKRHPSDQHVLDDLKWEVENEKRLADKRFLWTVIPAVGLLYG